MADTVSKCTVRRDDTVVVIGGRDKGKTGRVLRVYPARGRVLVEGVQLVKKNVRANPGQQQQGGIVEKEAAITLSNVMIVCGKCNRPTRVKRLKQEGARSVRVCRQCGEALGK